MKALPRLPNSWKQSIQTALLHVISLAQYALTEAHAQSEESGERTENERLRQQLALKDEELRIHKARMEQIPPQRRPHYKPAERLAILEMRSARNWTVWQTAEAFQVSEDTVRSWMKRLDEDGPEGLLQTAEPVNKFLDFVNYAVQRLKTLCPTLGKKKIAETLARAGLHLATTTVGRILKEEPVSPTPAKKPDASKSVTRKVTAKAPNDVWHVDLTTMPIGGGFWVPWSPLSLPQCWPFCFWVAVILDNHSRRVMGTAVFLRQPTSEKVRAFMGRTISNAGSAPKYLICDRGVQFDNDGFRRYCRKKGTKIRYGAVGKHGSIAIIERFILTLKTCLALLPLIPLSKRKFQRELVLITDWYNGSRPHTTLQAATPDEKYFGRFPACRKPRYEPRSRWPRGFAVCRTLGIDAPQSRRAVGAGGYVPRRAKALAAGHDQARRLRREAMPLERLPRSRCAPRGRSTRTPDAQIDKDLFQRRAGEAAAHVSACFPSFLVVPIPLYWWQKPSLD